MAEQIQNLMDELSGRYGKVGMQAIAALMCQLGSDALITWSNDTWVPCDFLMQHAWSLGGTPDTDP